MSQRSTLAACVISAPSVSLLWWNSGTWWQPPKSSESMASNSVFEIQQQPTHESTIKSSFIALPTGIKLSRIIGGPRNNGGGHSIWSLFFFIRKACWPINLRNTMKRHYTEGIHHLEACGYGKIISSSVVWRLNPLEVDYLILQVCALYPHIVTFNDLERTQNNFAPFLSLTFISYKELPHYQSLLKVNET